ncbi:PD-(D/E)XK nuclease family protein [Spiroplasma endosymbiont of Danaus chrysippus]|uniref:PD-(D/E)XK nuclease family protein n=1 Tax=Spiroplasma endosymbiont of Danaus chrysippus TaxID=2691041 RepID=UPI00157ACD80|nr:PD-(D/E)XK nuclease family protein [Spiroplasma endosymbiont of Danaus chrysippus]
MSKLIFKKETHQYFLEDKELISVSRIIDNYLSFDYSHIAPEVLKNASNRGKWVHKLNELYLQNINQENIINNLLKKLKPLTNTINYSYCKKSLMFLKEKFKDKNNYEFIIEKPITDNVIAGTPDLVYLDKNENKYYLVDYKTYACIDNDKFKRIQLQLTAYYCMLLANGISPTNKTYVYLTNKKNQKEIEIKITKKLIDEWLEAKTKYFKGENKNGI